MARPEQIRNDVTGEDFQATSGPFLRGPMCSNGTLAPVDYAIGVEGRKGEDLHLTPGMPLVTALRRGPEFEERVAGRIFTLTDSIYDQNADIVRAAVRILLNGAL